MSFISQKNYDSFLLKFGIDLRYSRARMNKRENLLKNDPEYRYCEHASIIFLAGGLLILLSDLFLILGLCDNFLWIAMGLGISFGFIGLMAITMALSLDGKCAYIMSQTPIEIVEVA